MHFRVCQETKGKKHVLNKLAALTSQAMLIYRCLESPKFMRNMTAGKNNKIEFQLFVQFFYNFYQENLTGKTGVTLNATMQFQQCEVMV